MSDSLTQTASPSVTLNVAPAQTVRGENILPEAAQRIAHLGQRPFLVAGDRTLNLAKDEIEPHLTQNQLTPSTHSYGRDCDEADLERLKTALHQHQADVVIGIGGGKALDSAKLLAYRCQIPVVTIPTSAATCAAWTALSNVYTPEGAFRYDVPLPLCPNLLVLDYSLIRTAPRRTLVAGIGDALAKWYEASVSSGSSDQTLIVAAVQQARVLRDYSCKNPPPPSPNPVAPSGGKWSMPAFS